LVLAGDVADEVGVAGMEGEGIGLVFGACCLSWFVVRTNILRAGLRKKDPVISRRKSITVPMGRSGWAWARPESRWSTYKGP
jgi:hypothetical protein